MASKFYKLIVNGYERRTGHLSLENEDNYDIPFISYRYPNNNNLDNICLKLTGGKYSNMSLCYGGEFISAELKDIFQSFIGTNPDFIEFIPAKCSSEEEGDRVLYLPHFKKVFDVMDIERTVYASGTDNVIRPCLDYRKVKNLHVFNTESCQEGIFVSEDVFKAIKKAKLTLGYIFSPILVSHIKDDQPQPTGQYKKYYRPVMKCHTPTIYPYYEFEKKNDNCQPVILKDGVPVKNLDCHYMRMKRSPYYPLAFTTTTMVVSKEFRDVLLRFIPKKLLRFIPKRSDYIEFLPVQVKNDTEGDRIMYIPHFTKVLDVLDEESTLYIDDSGHILLACVDYRKVKKLHVFKALSRTQQELILSEDVVNALEEAGLTDGYTFLPQYVSYKNE